MVGKFPRGQRSRPVQPSRFLVFFKQPPMVSRALQNSPCVWLFNWAKGADLGRYADARAHGMRHGVTAFQSTFRQQHAGASFLGSLECKNHSFPQYLRPEDKIPLLPLHSVFFLKLSSTGFLPKIYWDRSMMKFSSVILAVFALVSTGLADKTCTPSFDYCSDLLIKSKGKFTFPWIQDFRLIK